MASHSLCAKMPFDLISRHEAAVHGYVVKRHPDGSLCSFSFILDSRMSDGLIKPAMAKPSPRPRRTAQQHYLPCSISLPRFSIRSPISFIVRP